MHHPDRNVVRRLARWSTAVSGGLIWWSLLLVWPPTSGMFRLPAFVHLRRSVDEVRDAQITFWTESLFALVVACWVGSVLVQRRLEASSGLRGLAARSLQLEMLCACLATVLLLVEQSARVWIEAGRLPLGLPDVIPALIAAAGMGLAFAVVSLPLGWSVALLMIVVDRRIAAGAEEPPL